ncbi:unnamed protein product, partial [Rotaria sp. Silwood1]
SEKYEISNTSNQTQTSEPSTRNVVLDNDDHRARAILVHNMRRHLDERGQRADDNRLRSLARNADDDHILSLVGLGDRADPDDMIDFCYLDDELRDAGLDHSSIDRDRNLLDNRSNDIVDRLENILRPLRRQLRVSRNHLSGHHDNVDDDRPLDPYHVYLNLFRSLDNVVRAANGSGLHMDPLPDISDD